MNKTVFFKCILFFTIIFYDHLSKASEEKQKKQENSQFNLWEDIKTSFGYLGRGSYYQFSEAPSVVLIGAGGIFLAAAYFQRNELERGIMDDEYDGWHKIMSDMNIVLTLPVVSMTSYYFAKKYHKNKLKRFAQEYFATLYLTSLEVMALSFIPINKRPNKEGINAFEKNFRGDSSFPSGHMVPTSTLFWKVFQFYGPLWASLPGALTFLTAFERVRSERHHITDVIGTFFIAGLASEGVRIASGYKNNHPLYKWIFEHKLSFNFFKGKDSVGTMINFVF